MTTIEISNNHRKQYFEDLNKLFEKYFDWTHIFECDTNTLFFDLMCVADDTDKKQAISLYTMYNVEIGRKMGYTDAMYDIRAFADNKKEECIKC